MRSRFLFLVLGIALVSCGEPTSTPNARPRAGVIGPLCQLGCTETDPNPTAPGVFLGSGVTPEACLDGTDSDLDGLEDFCERNLAAAFAPELYYYNGDNVGREPHWVARISGGGKVMVGYLLSYYRDEGSQAWLCNQPPPFHDPSCEGHNGDSEAIFEEIYYDFANQHWVLNQASYSQHTSYGVYARGTKAYPFALFYPAHAGAYPRAYVAQGKHASYASRNECNSGGALGTDTCESVNTAGRIAAGANLNLGSRSNHSAAQDCMRSTNPSYEYYGSGRRECYWTQVRFSGWIPINVGGADSDPYSPRLQTMGF